jgi:hypothetical protein
MMTIVIVVCVALMGNAMVAQGQELLNNPGFEDGVTLGSGLSGWNFDSPLDNFHEIVATNPPAGPAPGGGTYSLRYDIGDPSSGVNRYADTGQGTPPHLGPLLSLNGKGNAVIGASVYMDEVIGDSNADNTVAALVVRFHDSTGQVRANINWHWDNLPATTTQIQHGGATQQLNLHIAMPTRDAWDTISENAKDLIDTHFPKGDGSGSWWTDVGGNFGNVMTDVSFQWHARVLNGDGSDPRKVDGWADNFSLVAVPEPMTMSLLALGALGMLRRKRS